MPSVTRPYVSCLEQHWPKEQPWCCQDISSVRTGAKNVSDGITKLIWEQTELPCKKPVLGQKLAESCRTEHIPQEVQDLFGLARSIAGISV